MKTKTLLLIFLFLGIGLTQLSAQGPPNNKNGNFTVSFWGEDSFPNDVVTPNGVLLKVVVTFTTHAEFRYKNGTLISINYQNHGTGLCEDTGEEFKYVEIGKQPIYSLDPLTGFDYFHFNMIGNHGSHVLVEAILDFSTWETTITKISWPGNK